MCQSVTGEKPVIIFVQDESICRSIDGTKKVLETNRKTKAMNERRGQGCHGLLFVRAAWDYFNHPAQLHEINRQRAQRGKGPLKYYIENEGTQRGDRPPQILLDEIFGHLVHILGSSEATPYLQNYQAHRGSEVIGW